MSAQQVIRHETHQRKKLKAVHVSLSIIFSFYSQGYLLIHPAGHLVLMEGLQKLNVVFKLYLNHDFTLFGGHLKSCVSTFLVNMLGFASG